jgi:hypothetical protein
MYSVDSNKIACNLIFLVQTKEDINTRSVMMTTRFASSIISSGEHPLRGACVERSDRWWLCGTLQFRTYLDCSAYCRKHLGKD